MLEMKPEIRDRVMSHDKPLVAAIYNTTYNQVENRHVQMTPFKKSLKNLFLEIKKM